MTPKFWGQHFQLCNGYCSQAHFSLEEPFVHPYPNSFYTATPLPRLMLSAIHLQLFLQVFPGISSLLSCYSYLLHSYFLSFKCMHINKLPILQNNLCLQSPNFRGLISATFIMSTHEYKKGLCRSLSTDLLDHPQCLVPSAGFFNCHLTWMLLAMDSIPSTSANSASRPS